MFHPVPEDDPNPPPEPHRDCSPRGERGNVGGRERLLEGLITELYDVQVLPGVQRPMALGFQSEEIRRLITLDPMGTLPNPKL